MSGYLQRMVAAAARPERRIRPFVGSIYAPSQASLAEEEVGVTFSETLARPTRREVDRPEPARREASGPPAAVEARSARSATREMPAGGRPLRGVETLPPASPDPPSQSPTPLAEPAPQPLAAPIEGAVTERTRLVEHWHEAAPEPRAGAPVSHDRLQPGPGPLPRPAPQLPRPRAEPARDAGEEVQIHIGRIEVIAPQPAPTQPAAPRAPRSTSLQDYLKRGAGRSR